MYISNKPCTLPLAYGGTVYFKHKYIFNKQCLFPLTKLMFDTWYTGKSICWGLYGKL